MQQTATIPPKGLGKLGWNDLLKGLIKSIAGLLVGMIIKTLQEKHIPPYSEIEPILEAVVYFIVGYLGINIATNNVGQMFTKDKPVVAVDAEKLDTLQKEADAPKITNQI